MVGPGRAMTRILIAGFKHETNTFSKKAANREAYQARGLYFGQEVFQNLHQTQTEIGAFLDFSEKEGWEVWHPIYANATPSGPVTREMFNVVLDNLLNCINVNGPFDGILLCLHGAMVCEHTDDGEGELLEHLRTVLGPNIPIAATLDLHANCSDRMAKMANILIPYRTYPHIDQYAVGIMTATMLKRTLAGEIKPVITLRRGYMLDGADHGRTSVPGPMTEVLAECDKLLIRPDVLTVGICAGFPWADTPYTGPSALIVGNGNHREHIGLADSLIDTLWSKRHITTIDTIGIKDALVCIKKITPSNKPVILADFGDNPGGGGYGDSTHLLQAMIEADLKNAAFATIFDPVAARICRDNGPGAIVYLQLGGHTDPTLGEPLEIRGTVKAITNGQFRLEGPMTAGLKVNMGTTAVVSVGGIDIVVTSGRFQVYDQMYFRHARIDPLLKSIVAVKSAHHFRAAFEPIASKVIVVDSPGITSRNFKELKYTNVRRPVFPLDLD